MGQDQIDDDCILQKLLVVQMKMHSILTQMLHSLIMRHVILLFMVVMILHHLIMPSYRKQIY